MQFTCKPLLASMLKCETGCDHFFKNFDLSELVDFVAPKVTTENIAADAMKTGAAGRNSLRKQDYIGVFAVTAGIGIEKKEAQFLAAHDDYSAILLKSLADRLAEAFAEGLHKKVHTDLWGYAADEALPATDLIAEKYAGIRPDASVSGFHIGHPDSTYFSVGKIGDDQLKDLAMRRGMDERDLQRLLASNL